MQKVSVYRIGLVAISVLFISFFISACAKKTTAQKTGQKTGQAGNLRPKLIPRTSSVPSNSEQAAGKEKKIANENLAKQLVGIWHEPSISANYQGKQLDMKAGFRIRVEANGTKVIVTVIGIPTTNATFTQSVYVPVNQPWIEAEVKEGRLIGTHHNFTYGVKGFTPKTSEPYDQKIEVSDDGSKFKIGEKSWEEKNGIYIKE